MIVLLILIGVFAIAILAMRLMFKKTDIAQAARIGMAAMLVFTGVGHFIFTKGMTLMIPDFIPFKKEVVLLTGVIELMAAIGLLIPRLRVLTGWLLILFFVLLLPANIHAALRHVDLVKGTFDGDGPAYLWFRIPLQVLFIVWIYLCAVRPYTPQVHGTRGFPGSKQFHKQ